MTSLNGLTMFKSCYLLHSKETNLSLIPNILINIDLNLVFLSCSLPRDILLSASFKSFDFFMFWSFIFLLSLFPFIFWGIFLQAIVFWLLFFFHPFTDVSYLYFVLFCFVYHTSQHVESNQGLDTQPLHWKCSLSHWTAKSFNPQVFKSLFISLFCIWALSPLPPQSHRYVRQQSLNLSKLFFEILI